MSDYRFELEVLLLILFCLVYFRPGFVRLNMPFFFDDATIDFILEAVDAIANHGWKLLPYVSCWHFA